jgi:spoIIIJ-associated protein
MDEKLTQQVQAFVTKIVSDLGFTPESITVSGEEKDDKTDLQVIIKGQDVDLLIGYHGKNLQSLHQLVVGHIKQIFPKEKRVSLFLDIGDYFEKQNEKLRQMVSEAIEEVKLLDEPYEFKPMAPRLRRIVHLEAEKHTGIRTESAGEGMDRRVIIYPGDATTPATQE